MSDKGEVWCVSMRIAGGDKLTKEELIEYCRNRLSRSDFVVDIQTAFNVKEALSRADLQEYMTSDDE
jgi:hypothetical protein